VRGTPELAKISVVVRIVNKNRHDRLTTAVREGARPPESVQQDVELPFSVGRARRGNSQEAYITADRPLVHGFMTMWPTQTTSPVALLVESGTVYSPAAMWSGPATLARGPPRTWAQPDTAVRFDYQALGAHMPDAHGEPLVVYQILEESTAQRGLTRLVGREHELGLLCERWTQVKDGLGQVVLLSGEAGIGKSRLVQALKEHLAGEVYTRVECRCSPYYQNTTLYPVVTHVQRLLRWHRGETAEEKLRKLEETLLPYGLALTEAVPLLATLLALPLPDHYVPLTLMPQHQKQKTLEILLAWLLAEVERQPMCFIVEDLHWADASTLEWLSLLIEQVPTTRLLLLLVFRPDFRPPWTPAPT